MPQALKLADQQYESKDYKSALKTLSSYIESNPENLEAIFKRGFIYLQLGYWIKARSDLYFVFDSDQDKHFPTAYLLGQVEEALGKSKEATEWYVESLKHPLSRRSGRTELERLKTKLEDEGETNDDGEIKKLKPIHPTIKLSDVVGSDELKQFLKKYVVLPIQHPELSKSYGLSGSVGLILYGPPGSGKSYIAQAVAGECEAYFLLGRINQLSSKWVGATSKNFHQLFTQAREHKPCIIFLDEIDAIASKRNSTEDNVGEGSANRSATNQLLMELSGADTSNEGIYIIAATNMPWQLDSALLRSGRFSELKYVGLPDKKVLAKLYEYYLKDKKIAKINYRRLARATQGYTPADVRRICEKAVHEFGVVIEFQTKKEHLITTENVITYIKRYYKTSSIGTWFSDTYKEVIGRSKVEWVGNKQHITSVSGKFSSIEKEYFRELVSDTIKQTTRGSYLGSQLGRFIALNLL